MALKIVPLSIRIADFNIAEDPAFESGKPFLSAKELYVRAGLIALLQKRLDVQSAALRSPAVELIRSGQGAWNFASLGGGGSAQGANALSLQRLRVEGGVVAITDHQAGKGRVVYDTIALALDDYAPGRKYNAAGSMHLPGPHREEIDFKFDGTDGTFTLREVTAGPAMVSGTGKAQVRADNITITSDLRTSDARLKTPVEVRSTVQYDRGSGKAVAEPVEVRLDKLTARGRVEVDTSAGPIAFRAALRAENAPVADLLAIANALQLTKGASGSGAVSIDVHAAGKGYAIAYTGTLSAGDATIVTAVGSPAVHVRQANMRLNAAQPPAGHFAAGSIAYDQIALDDASADFRFDGGVLQLSDVRAHAYGGPVAGTAAIDTRGPRSKIASNMKLTNVDAGKLLGATTAVKALSGALSGDADLQLAPEAGKQAAAGLSGTVRVLLTDGKLAGVHLLDHLSQVAKFLGDTNASKNVTAISKLAGTMRIQSGVARTDDLQVDFDGGSLTAKGSANLADETLDLDVAALLTKAVSDRVGGPKAGGWMTTVMASPRGELIIPAKVTGTFSKPRFLPDPARLVKVKFGTAGNAAATAHGLLDMFTKPKDGQPSGKETLADKAKPFTDLLESFGKKK